MAFPANKIYDLYASVLNFKEDITVLLRPAVSIAWVPEDHLRRLKAYEIFHSYYDNYSRDYRLSPAGGGTSMNDYIVEVGDPAWLCDKLESKLIGDELKITIPMPKKLGTDETLLKLIEATEDPEAKGKLQEDLDTILETKALVAQKEAYLQDWWNDYFMFLKLDENEKKCSYLGDCVYYVYWNETTKAPDITTYDPGFCFPYSDINAVSFQATDEESSVSIGKVKDRFIIAWEEEMNDTTILVYRDVYELRVKGDTFECWRQSAYYRLDGSSGQYIDSLDEGTKVDDGTDSGWLNLGIDFLPFVWIPNIQRQGEIFGESNLAKIIGVLDTLMTNYTDLDNNSAKLGGAVIALSGKGIKLKKDPTTGQYEEINIQPNQVFPLGESGRMDVMDTSQMQTALLATVNKGEEIMIRNSQITDIVAGKIDSGNIPSGVALTLLLQPLLDKIRPQRKQRQQHYNKLFQYVQKLYADNGTPEEKAVFAGDQLNVLVVFGRLIPLDRETKLKEYILMLNIFDEETVLNIAKEEGFEIDVKNIIEKNNAATQSQREADAQAFQFVNSEQET